MVIELDERTMDNALFSIKERTTFMLFVQVATIVAVLTIVGFHSRVTFQSGLKLALDLPLLPCITTTILAGIGIYCQVLRSTWEHMRIKLICSYLKDGKIVMGE